MTRAHSKTVAEYLALDYPFEATADPKGGYVIVFPDLPGCITQVESMSEIPEMAEDARSLWIETEYELGHEIPLPSYEEDFSGKFNVRIPRSLHRSLARAAEKNGVSLNHYVSDVLARGDSQDRVERKLDDLACTIKSLETPSPSPRRSRHVLTGLQAP